MKDELLKAIDLANKGQWEEAHNIARKFKDREGAWLHANLHREEGDLSNASYWYHTAGVNCPELSFREERAKIAEALNA